MDYWNVEVDPNEKGSKNFAAFHFYKFNTNNYLAYRVIP